MAPFGHKENSNESQDRSAGSIQQRNSIASQASNDPSLSDLIPADGFRPAADAGSPSSPSARTTPSNATDQAGRSHAGQTSDRQSAFRNRPSSVAKPHRPHESLTLRHEHNNASDTQPSFARASIASSEGPVLRPDSPYRGPTGPSHPYQMYPQRTLSDAPSSPTPTSTETPPATQQGPTHPYTLYTQSTAEIEETPSRAIPVGFTNLPDNYRRQIGPDGEEAGDLVGPMGHTEELPPYTRYPEIAYVRKEPSNETESISTPSSSTPGVPAIASGAGGIGRATRDPEFSSTEEDLPLDRSRPSVRSQSSRASSHNINTAAQEISEKSTRKEKWQRRAKKKLWGIVPYWAICLVMVGMVFMGIIMGAVIGTVLKKSDDQTRKAIAESEEEYPPPPKAPVAEVVPLTSLPGDLEDITVGTWGLPQLDKDEAPRKCFNNSLEFNAWSCDIPFRYYSIDITEIKNASKLSNYDLELFAINETDAQFIWGTQPPSVPKPIPLKLVNDTFDMGRGPAWWLNVTYNKTVIVPEANFPLPERRAKRATFDFDEHPASEFDMTRFRKGSKGAVEGDTPWICTWPDTTLEIFIYPNVNASLTETTETNSDEEADYTQPTPPSSEEYPTKAYPKVVKFLERRLSGNPNSTAVCRQVTIKPGWTWEDKKDEEGEPIRVEIVETSSPWEEQAVANDKREIVREWYGTTDNSLVRRDQQELTSCGCLWWST